MKIVKVLTLTTVFTSFSADRAGETQTQTLLVDGAKAKAGWQFHADDQALLAFTPGLQGILERLPKLDGNDDCHDDRAKSNSKINVGGAMCNVFTGCTLLENSTFTLREGQKKNFGTGVNAIFFGGGRHACHLSLYSEKNTPRTALQTRVELASILLTSTNSAVDEEDRPLWKSIGYFC